MPFILIMFGILLFVTAIRGTTGQLASLLSQDVFGQRGFIVWVVAVLVIGAVGYVQKLKGISDAFLVLLVLVLFLSNKGFFAQFNQALGQTQTKQDTTLPQGFGAAIAAQSGSNPIGFGQAIANAR